MIVSEVRRIMSLSLAPAPVSDRSSRSPPTRELIALSVLLFTQQAHTVNKESIMGLWVYVDLTLWAHLAHVPALS